jgi:hypothetical protein
MCWLLLALGVCAHPAGPLTAKEDAPPFSKSARLKAWKKKLVFHRRYRLPKDLEAAETPGVRTGKLGKRALLFLDVDGDGTFDELGIDGWAHPKGVKREADRFVFPLRDSVVLDGQVIRYRVHADGSRVDYEPTPIEAGPNILAGLAKLNDLRMQSGLLPVGLDAERSAKARKHVRYMVLNDAYGHGEEKGRPGYSEDGAWAGIYSVIDWGVTLEEAAERWWATLYHRLSLSDDRLEAVGAAASDGYAMFVPRSWVGEGNVDWPGIVPAPHSHGIATRAGRERPLPFPDGEQPGYPITLQFPGWNDVVTDAKAVLRSVSRKGRTKRVPVYFSDFRRPAHASRRGNDGAICLIPVKPLEAYTVYRVHVIYTWRGTPCEREWTFTTGPERKPPGKYAR